MYVYNADVYCDSCGEAIAAGLRADGFVDDGDSDGFPQYVADVGESDGPEHCASYAECREPLNLSAYGLPAYAPLYGAEARTIGADLSYGLTEHGVSYLREMLDGPDPTPYQSALHTYWREAFADYLQEGS